MSKSAFVSIVGRPSAGKSTLMNGLCGEKVSIVSPVPQTTRAAVRGILTRGDSQLIFTDTPGIHLSDKKMNLRLAAAAARALSDCDILLYLIDATRAPGAEEAAVAARVAARGPEAARRGTVAAVNKIDSPHARPDECAAFLAASLPGLPPEHIVRVSALKKTNLDALLGLLRSLAPAGPFYYGSEYYTDQQVAFRVAEIVREKCCLFLRDELPHALYVDASDLGLRGKTLTARALIRCERESQKGMIVGIGGAMIQKIREAALADLKGVFDWTVRLELRVKTDRNWRQRDATLKSVCP